jgi:glutamyl-Q tRNA(Asp) synthetase
LQAVLGLDTPRYHHHRLVSDESGRRLSKRDQDLTLAALRDSGVSAAAIRQRLGLV